MRPQDHEIELEPHPDQPWCATCERWEEDCECSECICDDGFGMNLSCLVHSLEIRAGSPNGRSQTDGVPSEGNGLEWIRPYPTDASHLSQSATDTAETSIQNYWKESEGRCLACNAEIAIEDQYCPSCESFLLETLPTTDPNLTA